MGCQQCEDEGKPRQCGRTLQQLLDDAREGVKGNPRFLTDENGHCSEETGGCGHIIGQHTDGPTTEPQGAAGTRHPLPLGADGRSVEEQLQGYDLPVRSRDVRLAGPQLIGGGTTRFPGNINSLNGTDGPCCTVFGAWFTAFQNQGDLDKTTTPAPYLPASPGMGKTRLLQVLATPASSEANNINGRAKQDALAAFERQEHSQDDERNQFCSAFREAIGVYCTFNSGQEVRSSHHPDSLADEESALAARLYYAYWIDMGTRTFTQFCERFQWSGICVDDVVQAIRADIDNKERPLVICVDEVMLWGGKGDTRGERITNCIKAIAELPVHHPHVYTVVSSLEPETVRHGVMGTNRTPVAALLSPVDNPYASKLLSPLVDGGVQNWLATHLEMLIQDCGGSPRLLEHLAKALRDWKGETRLEQLSQVLSSVSAVSNFQDKFLLDTEAGMQQLFRALSLAVRGQRVPVQILGELSMAGFISQSFKGDAIPWIPPLYLMLFQTALDRRSENELASTTSTILRWFRSYLAYDQSLPNQYIATNLEVQFAFAWGMRCRVLFSSDSQGQPTTETVKNVSLSEVLVTDERDKVNRPILVLCKATSAANDAVPFRDMNVKEFCGSVLIPVGVMIRPTNPNNEGYDLLAVYDTPRGEQFAIVIQVKYSASNTSTSLSNQAIVTAVRNTVKHHPYLHRFINNGRFLFVFAAHRPANDNVSIAACRQQLEKAPKCDGGKETENLVSTVVDKHLHLMLQHDIERFLGPTLYARPQFWLPERSEGPSKKRKTR